jgi:hypothetical protein
VRSLDVVPHSVAEHVRDEEAQPVPDQWANEAFIRRKVIAEQRRSC